MPELLRANEFSLRQNIYGLASLKDVPKLKKVIREQGLTYISDGCECIVAKRKGNTDKVIAFNYYEFDIVTAKRLIVIQRLLHTIFPHNFPIFHTIYYGNQKSKTPGVSIRYEIKTAKDIVNNPHFTTKYPFEKVEKTVKELGLPVEFDSATFNYKIGPDGGEYFLDTPKEIADKEWNQYRTIKYMQNSGYSKVDIDLVSKSINRLQRLNQ